MVFEVEWSRVEEELIVDDSDLEIKSLVFAVFIISFVNVV